MQFIVMRAGQVIHEGEVLPGAVPTPIGVPAIEGTGDDEHLGHNYLDGWTVELDSVAELLRIVDTLDAQVMIRRPTDFLIGGRPAYIIDLLPGIGH